MAVKEPTPLDMSEKDTIVLAALLHDIGKLVQRAQKDPRLQSHCRWGEEWFDKELGELREMDSQDIIIGAISKHHDWVDFITLADGISAGMDRIPLDDEEKGDPFTDRLISIFSRISVSNKPKEDKYHTLTCLSQEDIKQTFPIEGKKCSFQDYKKLLGDFTRDISSVDFKALTPLQIINVIYFLLWKYTWSIPSAAYKDEPDISLFDHLKTTAAITSCLYDYKQENPNTELDIETSAFSLLEGDISGIQSYIFSILTQQGKVAKRLRARSLFVQLISEIAAHKILHEFNLPLCNLISSAGGNFQILLPNLKTTDSKIKELQKEFDEWALEELNAELSINLATIELSGKDLDNFSKVIEKLKNKLVHRKHQPHKLALTSGDGWVKEQFLRPKSIESDETACHSCRKYPQTEEYHEEKLCKYCWRETKIGELIPKKKYIALFRNKNQEFEVLDYSFKLLDKKELEKFAKDAYTIFTLNDTEIKLPAKGFKFFANYIPTASIGCNIEEHEHKEDEPLFFDCIAEKSRGDKLLGYLKIDVDNLSRLLRYGFDPDEPDNKHKIQGIKPSISRFATLSRVLETFFAGYIQAKLEKKFKVLYTVFSGGDDIFVIGPWNTVIDFAKEMREEFSKYCANNPDLTFSAGIILSKPHEPISFCSETAENALKAAKNRKNKDGVTIFDQTVGWNVLDKILEEAKKVIGWIENDLISHNFAYILWQCGTMYQKYEKTGNTNYLEFAPMLAGSINRNLDPQKQAEIFRWASSLLPSKRKVFSEKLQFLKTIMEYVLNYMRR